MWLAAVWAPSGATRDVGPHPQLLSNCRPVRTGTPSGSSAIPTFHRWDAYGEWRLDPAAMDLRVEERDAGVTKACSVSTRIAGAPRKQNDGSRAARDAPRVRARRGERSPATDTDLPIRATTFGADDPIGEGRPLPVSDPSQLKLGLVQRLDLMAVVNPRSVRRGLWSFGVLGLWAVIGAVSSLSVQDWMVAAITIANAALSGLVWWQLRRSMRRIPETSQ